MWRSKETGRAGRGDGRLRHHDYEKTRNFYRIRVVGPATIRKASKRMGCTPMHRTALSGGGLRIDRGIDGPRGGIILESGGAS